MTKGTTWLATAGVVAELLLAGYLCLIAWLLCVWMVNDSAAFRMTAGDWYLTAAVRFLVACGLSVVFGAVAHFFNRWAFPARPMTARLLTWALSGAICLCGLAGAVNFAVTKPYM
jgi:hypothetical protein